MAWTQGYNGVPGIGSAAQAAQSTMHMDDYAATGDAQGAAISVAVMIVTAAVFLAVLKRSGFRAMVAVGRG